MSPPPLRRFRADRLLRRDFEGLRVKVLAAVRGRLLARGVRLDAADLDACYSLAWHGLYAATLAGERIESPGGWLTLVAYRRALDEHRARGRVGGGGGQDAERGEDRDLAAELDDRARLGALFEGIRDSLTARERQAAVLCYLHGLSRREAAHHMGISEERMRKLMEGRGNGRPGVSSKIATLARTIEAGHWCEQRGSLMRALAYGILDTGGERYLLAVTHHRRCPACRAYVASLRGLAILLPPAALPAGMLAGITGGAATGGLAAAGLAGGAGSGGWVLAGGPLGAKLAVGCLLALGAGCATLGVGGGATHPRHRDEGRAKAAAVVALGAGQKSSALPTATATATGRLPIAVAVRRPPVTPGVAGSEFGLEAAARARSAHGPVESARVWRTAGRTSGAGPVALSPSGASAGAVALTAARSGGRPASSPIGGAASGRAAEQEFGPG